MSKPRNRYNIKSKHVKNKCYDISYTYITKKKSKNIYISSNILFSIISNFGFIFSFSFWIRIFVSISNDKWSSSVEIAILQYYILRSPNAIRHFWVMHKLLTLLIDSNLLWFIDLKHRMYIIYLFSWSIKNTNVN